MLRLLWLLGCVALVVLILTSSSAFATTCPSGYHKDGNYCVANSEKSKPIIPKSGRCPSGWHPNGQWCAKN